MAHGNPASAVAEERDKSRKLGSLAALWPYMAPYKALMIGATLALIATATVSLTLPMAVRRVIDNFNAEDGADAVVKRPAAPKRHNR